MRALAALKRFLPAVEPRLWVYPQAISGRFNRIRIWLAVILMGLLFITPWLRIDDMPAILFDLGRRRFIIFGNVFWPHDAWLLIFLLLLLALVIFLFTALYGRVWCGYACPQSVFLTQVYLRFERLIEGDRNQQMRRDAAGWSWDRIWRKGVKHVIFVAVASLVAHTFLAYFIDARELAYAIFHPSADYRNAIVFASLFTLLFYVDFAFLREQFCNYLCPYARFQSALLDRDSLVVAYDPSRGEPRGNLKVRRDTTAAYGDCIDCAKCVVVCPQGIDIRNGLQLECIHCASCIDACDSVMTKIGKPTGLIRYASENELDALQSLRTQTAASTPAAGSPNPVASAPVWHHRLLRPRTVIYSALLLIVASVFVLQLLNRRLTEATLTRPPGPVYTITANGDIANHFRIPLINKDVRDHSYHLTLDAPAGWGLVTPLNPVVVPAGELRPLEVFVTAPADTPYAQRAFAIRIAASETGEVVTVRGTLIRPNTPNAPQEAAP